MRFRPVAWMLPLVLVWTAGCAEKHWTSTTRTEEQFYQDSYECAAIASGQAEHLHVGSGSGAFGARFEKGAEVNKDIYRACLNARGYRRVEGGKWEGIRD